MFFDKKNDSIKIEEANYSLCAEPLHKKITVRLLRPIAPVEMFESDEETSEETIKLYEINNKSQEQSLKDFFSIPLNRLPCICNVSVSFKETEHAGMYKDIQINMEAKETSNLTFEKIVNKVVTKINEFFQSNERPSLRRNSV